MTGLGRFLSLAASLLAVALSAQAQDVFSSSKPQPPQRLSFAQKFFFESGGTNEFRDEGRFFEMDSSVKDHPPGLDGSSVFVGFGYQFKPTASFAIRAFSQSAAGNGPWRRLTGNAIVDSFAATADGRTDMSNSGLLGIFRKERKITNDLDLLFEGGGGIRGVTTVNFHGIVTAIDPQSGQSFQMPASDRVSRRTPTAVLGIGFYYRFRFLPGIQVGPLWECILPGYSKPRAPFVDVRFFPFQAFARKKGGR